MIFPLGNVIYGLFGYTKSGRILIFSIFLGFRIVFLVLRLREGRGQSATFRKRAKIWKINNDCMVFVFRPWEASNPKPHREKCTHSPVPEFLRLFQIFAEGKVVDVGDFCRFVSNCRESCFVLLALSAAEIPTFSNFLAGNFARSSKFGHLNFVVIWIVLFALSLVNSLGG